MRAPSPAFRRYLLLELPGWVVAATAVWALVEYAGLDARFGAGLVALWVAKDFVLYPWLRHAYEPGDPHPSATLAGRRARVTTRLDPGGYVQLGSERWRAAVRAIMIFSMSFSWPMQSLIYCGRRARSKRCSPGSRDSGSIILSSAILVSVLYFN